MSRRTYVSWHVLSVRIWISSRMAKTDWCNGRAREMQTGRCLGHQTYREACSFWAGWNFTVRWDVSGSTVKGVHVSYPEKLRRGGLWARWRITGHSRCHGDCRGWRRWIASQHSPVNHQSPPTPIHPLLITDANTPCTHILTRFRSRNGTKSHSGWVLLTNQLKLSEDAAPSYISLLSISHTLLSSFFPFSPPHITFTVISVWAFAFVTCSSLHLFFFLFHYSAASSKSQGSSPPYSSLCHSGISVSCVSLAIFAGPHNRDGKSLLTF